MFPTRQEIGYEARNVKTTAHLQENGITAKAELIERAKKFEHMYGTKKAKYRASAARKAASAKGWTCRDAPVIKPDTMSKALEEAAAEDIKNKATVALKERSAEQADAAAVEMIKQGATEIAQQTANSPAGRAQVAAMLAAMREAAPSLVPTMVGENALKQAKGLGKRTASAPSNDPNSKKARAAQTSDSDSDL